MRRMNSGRFIEKMNMERPMTPRCEMLNGENSHSKLPIGFSFDVGRSSFNGSRAVMSSMASR